MYTSKDKHPIAMKKEDLNYTKRFVDQYDALECLSEKYIKKSVNIDEIMKGFTYLPIKMGKDAKDRGKCIHNTDNVQVIKSHGSIVKTPKTITVKIFCLTI